MVSFYCQVLQASCESGWREQTNELDHHHHQVPDLEQTLAAMPLQTSLSSDNFKKCKPLLCPPVAELQRLWRNVIRCLPLSRLPSFLPVKDKNSKPLRLHTCPKNSICLFLIVSNSDLWTFPSLNIFTLVFFSVHEILNIRLINHISAASIVGYIIVLIYVSDCEQRLWFIWTETILRGVAKYRRCGSKSARKKSSYCLRVTILKTIQLKLWDRYSVSVTLKFVFVSLLYCNMYTHFHTDFWV